MLTYLGCKSSLKTKDELFNRIPHLHAELKVFKTNFPGFIGDQEWPPYFLDLYPMDYSVKSDFETSMCAKTNKSLAFLKEKILLHGMEYSITNELRLIAENFVIRLKLCIKAKSSHFENL